MKTCFTFFAFALSQFIMAAPVEVMVPIEHIYAPQGFDANDNTEVIVEGLLPSICHKAPKSTFEVNGKVINIKVTANNFQRPGEMCLTVLVPFMEKVDVGILDKGNYEILVNGKSPFQKKSAIRVDESSSDAIDEYVYANIESIEETGDPQKVILRGHNPSDCFMYDKTEVINNKSDTYSVLPVMKQVSDFCPMKMVPFAIDFEIPRDIQREKVLLHVRSMMGKSVNKIQRFR